MGKLRHSVARRVPKGHQAGYSLLELTFALSIFVALSLSLVTVVNMSRDSHEAVQSGVALNEELRTAVGRFADDLKSTRDANINVVALADGNSQVTFQCCLEVGGAITWGVQDRNLGNTDAEQIRPGWSLRYTVESVVDATGYTNRSLVRQIVDAGGAVQWEDVVAEGLHDGNATTPGFVVQQAGDMWEVSFATDGHATNTNGRQVVFHVGTRN